MDREYVLCGKGHKSYRIPGEDGYYCSECELNFTSDDEPKIDSGERIADVKPNEEEPKEEEPMPEKKKKMRGRKPGSKNRVKGGVQEGKAGQCESCAHKKVCGITPKCPDYLPIGD